MRPREASYQEGKMFDTLGAMYTLYNLCISIVYEHLEKDSPTSSPVHPWCSVYIFSIHTHHIIFTKCVYVHEYISIMLQKQHNLHTTDIFRKRNKNRP